MWLIVINTTTYTIANSIYSQVLMPFLFLELTVGTLKVIISLARFGFVFLTSQLFHKIFQIVFTIESPPEFPWEYWARLNLATFDSMPVTKEVGFW